MNLRALWGLQVTISVYADKGLLDKSTVVRIRLGRPSTVDSPVRDRLPPSLSPPVMFDALLEFPSEEAPARGRLRA